MNTDFNKLKNSSYRFPFAWLLHVISVRCPSNWVILVPAILLRWILACCYAPSILLVLTDSLSPVSVAKKVKEYVLRKPWKKDGIKCMHALDVAELQKNAPSLYVNHLVASRIIDDMRR